MRLRVLGSLQVRSDDGWLPINAPKERGLLATLLLHTGTPVPTERLIEELWPEGPPRRPGNRIAVLVLRLRRTLGNINAGAVQTADPGYQLTFTADDTDAGRFDRLVTQGTAALRDGDPATASRLFGDALALWRGPAFADVRFVREVNAEAERLEETRQSALESRFDAELRLGRHAEMIPRLQALVDACPLRESAYRLLMLALYRSGRQADALATYREAYRRLNEELGIQPGPDLQRLHEQILRADPALRLTTAPAVPEPDQAQRPSRTNHTVPDQLPAVTRHFVGREQDLKRLDELSQTGGRAMTVTTITGTAGIGKTSLAVRWARHAARRFPDGRLYVNLRGFDPSRAPLSPDEALGLLLDTLTRHAGERQPQHVPAGLDGQAAMYRSLVANRRMLILLDNAADVDQVRPLLPGSSNCFVLVTSRQELTGLVVAEGAHPIRLDQLTDNESEQLLVHHLGPERVAAEPDATAALATACAHLPLALTIAAARAATRPTMSLSELAKELDGSASGPFTARLDAFDTGDPATRARTVFSWSYDNLSTEAARLFRMLSLHPGPDISTAAAASLTGLRPVRAGRLLTELVRANLLTEHPPGRYWNHDLLRAYATELGNELDIPAERNLAFRRTLDHYLQASYAATLRIPTARKLPDLPEPAGGTYSEEFTGRAQATAWFSAEHHVLIRVIALAAQNKADHHTVRLTWCVNDFLSRAGHWRDQLFVQRLTLDAAIRLGDRAMQSFAHRALGAVHGRLGSPDDALVHFQQALEMAGGPLDRAAALGNLSNLYERIANYPEALRCIQEAFDIYRTEGDRQGQANCLNTAGWLYTQLGSPESALAPCRQALELFRDLDDPNGQANSWDSLGWTLHRLGRQDEAVTCFEKALELFRKVGARLQEAESLIRLGTIQHEVGDVRRAREAWQQALAFLDETGHPQADLIRAKLRQTGDYQVQW